MLTTTQKEKMQAWTEKANFKFREAGNNVTLVAQRNEHKMNTLAVLGKQTYISFCRCTDATGLPYFEHVGPAPKGVKKYNYSFEQLTRSIENWIDNTQA